MQRLFNKAKGLDGADGSNAKPGESSTTGSQSDGSSGTGSGTPEMPQPEPPERRRDVNPERRRPAEEYNRYLDTEPVPDQAHPVLYEHYLIDPRHMSADELQIVVDRMVNLAGIKRDRILIVEADQFGVMIVEGERK